MHEISKPWQHKVWPPAMRLRGRSKMALFKVARGEIWRVDFEPQTHKEEPCQTRPPSLCAGAEIVIESVALKPCLSGCSGGYFTRNL
jgi:hypothetical protein